VFPQWLGSSPSARRLRRLVIGTVAPCAVAAVSVLAPLTPLTVRAAALPAVSVLPPLPVPAVHAAGLPVASGGVALDGYGGIHPFGGVVVSTAGAPYWAGWDIARSLRLEAGGLGGWVLDGFGGIHSFGAAPVITSPAYWSGWDIARDLVVLGDARSGYLLDGFGGIHPFGSAPVLSGAPHWSGWDIARGLAIHLGGNGQPDGGWVLDAYGGIHNFGAAPALPSSHAVSGLDLWRHIHATSSGGAYLVGRWGIVDSVGTAPGISWSGMPDWGAWDIVRDVVPVDPVGGWNPQGFRPGAGAALMSALQSLDRVQRGAPALAEDGSLDSIAGGSWTYNLADCAGPQKTVASRSADLLARNYFAHPILGCSGTRYVFTTYETGVPYGTAGENIAWRTDGTSLVDDAVNINIQWLNSPEHFANIMNRSFTRVGCGPAFTDGGYQGASGPLWIWTCEFTG
jgi:Cysteine-rich secretory protein family